MKTSSGNGLTSVRVLGKDYAIVADEMIGREAQCFGELRMGRGEIAIDPKLYRLQQGETLLHEVLHAVDDGVGVGLDESKTRALSNGLYAFLRDNPEIVRAIVDGNAILSASAGGAS